MRRSSLATAMVVGVLLCGAVPQASAASLEEQVTKLRAQIRKDVGVKLPPVPVPANNPQTRDKVKLGEALFFDHEGAHRVAGPGPQGGRGAPSCIFAERGLGLAIPST